MAEQDWSWDLPDETRAALRPKRPATPKRPKRALPPRDAAGSDAFQRTILFTVLGTILPGLGLIAGHRRKIGVAILSLFVLAGAGVGLWALIDLDGLLSLGVKPRALLLIAGILVVGALVWVGVVISSHLSLRPRRISRSQRVTGSILVGVLAFAVGAPLAVGARYSYDQAGLVSSVFESNEKSKSATRPTMKHGDRKDPWRNKPRVNILLLGGDAGKGRTGTRTDTVIVASIDTKTGDTTMFSLPRNTARMPFPEDSKLHDYYPEGFTDGNGDNAEFFLNAIYQNVPANVPEDVIGDTDNLGADALKLSVGEALGLPIDYYLMVNLSGFKKMINALGGIRLNVNTYIPIGGSTDKGVLPHDYLEPGENQLLGGEHALWYARSRWGSDDTARMDRQRCVINAMINQANPANVLTRYEAIAKAGKDIVLTDLPQEVLPAMVELSLRVKDGNVRSIVFRHGASGFYSGNPDYDRMRERVQIAIGEAEKPPKKENTPAPGSSSSPSGDEDSPTPEETDSPDNSSPDSSGSSSPSASSTPESEDVTDSCAWRPEIAATAEPPQTQ